MTHPFPSGASVDLGRPQRDPSEGLEVLGVLESEGGVGDGVWVLGLTDEALPAPPGPNPFIPLSVLRKAEAPRATPERELEWAGTMYADRKSTRLNSSH